MSDTVGIINVMANSEHTAIVSHTPHILDLTAQSMEGNINSISEPSVQSYFSDITNNLSQP